MCLFYILLYPLFFFFCIKGDWSVSAIKEFRRLCELKLLVGLVDEYINDVLYLFLCDTSSDDDVYLHNVLKLEGHALICRENIPSKVKGRQVMMGQGHSAESVIDK